MEEKEWTVSKDVEDVVFRHSFYSNRLLTLKHSYKLFKMKIKEHYFMHPPESILTERTCKDGTIQYIFEYKYIDEEGCSQRNLVVGKTPDNPSTNWGIHQAFSIMQDMYVLKLNQQILNKEAPTLQNKIESGEYKIVDYDINDEQPH